MIRGEILLPKISSLSTIRLLAIFISFYHPMDSGSNSLTNGAFFRCTSSSQKRDDILPKLLAQGPYIFQSSFLETVLVESSMAVLSDHISYNHPSAIFDLHMTMSNASM